MAKIVGKLKVQYSGGAVSYEIAGQKAPDSLAGLPKYVGEIASKAIVRLRGAVLVTGEVHFASELTRMSVEFSAPCSGNVHEAIEQALVHLLVADAPAKPVPVAVAPNTDAAQVAALGAERTSVPASVPEEAPAPKKAARKSWGK
jgi:hypothetical protein